MKDDEQTRALLAILKLGEDEIKRGQLQDIDQFLTELEGDEGCGARDDD